MAITISLLALLATFYQLYLQRVHNEKSLKPLGQIDLLDQNRQLTLWVANNGMGPMIIDKLTFFKEGNSYTNIEDCLQLETRSYRRILINKSVKKVVLPHAYLEVFATEFEQHEEEAQIENARKQLTPITLKVDYRDIYENHFTLERNLEWFSRHVNKENQDDGPDSGVKR
ncbi:MAG: hypothetical protein U0X91_31500 [Spirosomataceae bacterium]